MPNVWDEITEKVNEAVDSSAGVPFPERFKDIAVELVVDVAIWAADVLTEPVGGATVPPADPSFAAPPPPDPPDAGANDPSGVAMGTDDGSLDGGTGGSDDGDGGDDGGEAAG